MNVAAESDIMPEDPYIRDIPTIKKVVTDAKALKALQSSMPLLRPLLHLIGIDTTEIDAGLAKTDELQVRAEELAALPDRFNELFSSRGWIVYDLMNVEVAQSAIRKAETGDMDGAELTLIDYFNDQTVGWQLRAMQGVKAFRPRMRLAELALVDYQMERYHACVPIVLALLDGMVSELNQERLGFFAEDVNVEAWDSIAAHSKGLSALANIFRKGRRKTTTEEITIPFRNGILHGMDLNYDNRIVAAKTWAALFATRDWAIKAEKKLLSPPPPENTSTWKDAFQKIYQLNLDKNRIAEWKPRTIIIGENILSTGEPNNFESGSPEQKLSEYLTYWKSRNYGFMAKCLSKMFGNDLKVGPARVREIYESKKLNNFAFSEIRDVAPAVTEIQTDLIYEERGLEITKSVRFRLVSENENGDVSMWGKPGSYWAVMNWGHV